jgi:hypothetical protein
MNIRKGDIVQYPKHPCRWRVVGFSFYPELGQYSIISMGRKWVPFAVPTNMLRIVRRTA